MRFRLALPCPRCAYSEADPDTGLCLHCEDWKVRLKALSDNLTEYYSKRLCPACKGFDRYTENGRCTGCTPDPARPRKEIHIKPRTPGKPFKPVRLHGMSTGYDG